MCGGKTTALKDGLCGDCLHQAYLHWREIAHSAVLDSRALCLQIRWEGMKMRRLVNAVMREGKLPAVRDRKA